MIARFDKRFLKKIITITDPDNINFLDIPVRILCLSFIVGLFTIYLNIFISPFSITLGSFLFYVALEVILLDILRPAITKPIHKIVFPHYHIDDIMKLTDEERLNLLSEEERVSYLFGERRLPGEEEADNNENKVYKILL